VCHWSLRDPLCLSQSLPVVRALARERWRMGLVTYEQPPWALSEAERRGAREELSRDGIEWWPLPYHRRPAGAATVFDVARGAARGVREHARRGVRLFHGRATVGSAVAWLASRATGARFFDDADSPLSEEYADVGVWRRGSLRHRLTGSAERRFLASADALAVLTERRRAAVARETGRDAVVLPCGVDTSLFAPRRERGLELRRRLGLSGSVLVYAGKSGGWYATDAMLEFARAAGSVLGPLSLLVLTPEPPERFESAARSLGLACRVLRVERERMPEHLSAADAALSFIVPAPSKAASSPVKNGEYLACGLPVVTTDGVGDYSELIARRRVGVVVERLEPAAYEAAARRLRDLLRGEGLAERCRSAALEEVGLYEIVIPRYLRVYAGLLGSPAQDQS
jgi:glycosyltransferase involved in cell wall biosynthesis